MSEVAIAILLAASLAAGGAAPVCAAPDLTEDRHWDAFVVAENVTDWGQSVTVLWSDQRIEVYRFHGADRGARCDIASATWETSDLVVAVGGGSDV